MKKVIAWVAVASVIVVGGIYFGLSRQSADPSGVAAPTNAPVKVSVRTPWIIAYGQAGGVVGVAEGYFKEV